MKLTNLKRSGKYFVAICMFTGLPIVAESISATELESCYLSVQKQSTTLQDLFDLIEKKFDYSFLIRDKDLNLNERVVVDLEKNSVETILKAALKNQHADFVVNDKRIIIYKANTMKPGTSGVSQQHQDKRVTVTVFDALGPVIGASVVEVGTTNGIMTDMDGKFELSVKANGSLQVSYVGFVTQTIKPGNKNNIQIILQEDNQALDEVVVVAFGKSTKEAFTGSAGIMKSDDLLKAQVSNPAQALAGRVAGVQLSNSSSQPGSSPSITIRGFGSISSDTEPLIVVDGMPFDGDLNLINSNDIESMTVLKDAASNALYGARGANGVIMITTKKGKNGDAKVSVDAKWGANSNGLQNYKTTNAQQFYETYYKMLYNYYITEPGGSMSATDAHALANQHLTNSSSGVGPGYMIYTVPEGQDFIQQGGVMNPGATMGALYDYNGQKFWLQADDWEEIGLQNGFRQEYNVSVSGASERINYYTSIGYLDQDGIQEGSMQKRLTARAKLDYQAKKWLKVGANFNYTKYNYSQTSEGTIGTGTIWSTIKSQAPIYPVYLRDANKNIMIDQCRRCGR